MFVGRTGRTISKTSNIDDLYQSIYSVILQLPHETIIYPGHNYGYQKTISLKKNILISKFFQCKSIDNFKKVMLNFEANFNKNEINILDLVVISKFCNWNYFGNLFCIS